MGKRLKSRAYWVLAMCLLLLSFLCVGILLQVIEDLMKGVVRITATSPEGKARWVPDSSSNWRRTPPTF